MKCTADIDRPAMLIPTYDTQCRCATEIPSKRSSSEIPLFNHDLGTRRKGGGGMRTSCVINYS